MVQRRGRLRFAVEAVAGDRIVGDLLGEQFEGDEPVQPGVLGLVHHTHATTAEDAEKPIVRDGAL